MSWPIVKLGEIFDITSSKRVHEIDWRNEGVPFYRAREVAVLAKEGRVDNDLFIDESMYEEFKAKYGVPKVGDLLVTAVGTLGKVYAVQESDRFYFKDASVIWLRARQEVDTSYIQHAMNSTDVQRFIQNSSGATVGAYTISRANETEIPLPPLPEQKRIAAILDKADAIRRKRQQAIQLADDFLRAVFLDMFGDPVTNPKGWSVKPLSAGIRSISSGWSATGENRPCGAGEKGVLKISAVTSGVFKPEENKVVSLDQIPDGKKLLIPKKGDLLFSRANTRELVAASCIVSADVEDVFLPDKLWLVETDQGKILPEFLNYLLWQPRFKEKLTSQATGTSGSMLNISKLKFEETDAIFPGIALQEKFKRIYWALQGTIDASTTSREKVDNLFHSLSQKAFSGQL
ncbi:restriction endonuclease subunit S [Pseudomonas aeruginosa]|uniref:restriction endonuclease subunit S n=1 Tax=Pseudomonas aeruginosa TaxID=287 RepID=UPI002711D434|nr:restriction endonuclease subunit S [Pseudomonas aeruginosa]WKY62087.1 restriction endonuclease subunit S [Pseudomonas aeruginosa]WKY67958.1 restriction endonuclease subunit S [Pseudomonas aeruginosa]WKY73835.1 restriction endonuclease subunit S [Pseudomonas aeruginosa]